ncbi:MAG: RNA polymerase sigma factor [Solobacterium sp.]|nr:RNA polymerase sigma factor [Solobacterium sp.]
MSERLDSEWIYTEYRDKVFSYVRSKLNNYHDAEDLCEDIFIKIYKNIDRFDEEKSSLSTWIFNITRNSIIDFYRTNKTNYEIIDNYDYIEEEDAELDALSLEILAKALEQLPEILRDIIVLHYYEENNLKEVSEKLNISYGIVKLRHKEALFKLKNLLKDQL